jgi:hypothetical protein
MRKNQVVFLSSDPKNGATDVSADGDRFSVRFSTPIKVGSNATASVISASVWWQMSNISALPPYQNNTFYYTDTIGDVKKFKVELPEGLYGPGEIESAINRIVVSRGQPDGLFKITGILETARIQLTITAIGWHVHFPADVDATADKSIKFMLGMDESFPGTRAAPALTTTDAQYIIALNPAVLNTITNIMISSSLGGGAVLNGTQTPALASFAPDVSIGDLIRYQPVHPLTIEIPPQTVQAATFWLTDQSGVLGTIDTQEHWTVTLLLEYD